MPPLLFFTQPFFSHFLLVRIKNRGGGGTSFFLRNPIPNKVINKQKYLDPPTLFLIKNKKKGQRRDNSMLDNALWEILTKDVLNLTLGDDDDCKVLWWPAFHSCVEELQRPFGKIEIISKGVYTLRLGRISGHFPNNTIFYIIQQKCIPFLCRRAPAALQENTNIRVKQ